MPTKTKRPLKKGDKCWVRIQRQGAPVLAVYDEPFSVDLHRVRVNGELVVVTKNPPLYPWEAIFVAKPIPPEAQNAD